MAEQQQAGVSVSEPRVHSRWSMAVWILLALLAHLALLDAAIETFWGGSPLRWWLSPALVALFALSVFLWRPGGKLLRRYGPAGAAGSAILVLLAVLAATAWLPSGQEDGVRAFLQPTSRLLIIAVALGVLLAGLVLLRAGAAVPGRARLAVVAVAALSTTYAVVAFVVAVRNDVTLAAVLADGGLWERWPRWLQGPFLGLLLLLPCAVCVQLYRFIGTVRLKRPSSRPLFEGTAYVLIVVMGLSGVHLPRTQGNVATGSTGPWQPNIGDAEVTDAQLRRQLMGDDSPADAWTRHLKVVRELLSKPGADPSDLPARAAALGHDEGKIFEFIRDQIALEPYEGELRGARGTLVAEGGNALDRALLAAALLHEAGFQTRLVTGRLSGSQADALWKRYLAMQPVPGPLNGFVSTPKEDVVTEAAADIARKSGLREDGVTALARRNRARTSAFWWATEEQRATDHAWLVEHVKGTPAGAKDDPAKAERLQERFQHHYWIQTLKPDGRWSDFDPTFADARPGVVYGSAPSVLDQVPQEERHRLVFAVRYETSTDGAPKMETLLEHEFPVSEALFSPPEFVVLPADPGLKLQQLVQKDTKARIQGLRKTVRFRAVLRQGTKVVPGLAFDLQGRTYGAPGGHPANSVGDSMGGLFGGLSGSESQPEFVKLEAEMRLTGPGSDTRAQTRVLVSAKDTKDQAFTPPLLQWQLYLQGGWIPEKLAAFEQLSSLVVIDDAVKAAKGGWPSGQAPVSAGLLQFTVLREAEIAGELAGAAGIKALIDRPLLTIASQRVTKADPVKGEIVTTRALDIVENGIRYVTAAGTSPKVAFDAALRQAVGDSVLEQRIVGVGASSAGAESGANFFRKAELEHRPIVWATAADTASLRNAGVGDDDIAWIRSNEPASAHLLITSTAEGEAAWWSVRQDGNGILRVRGGHGQASEEEMLVTEIIDTAMLAVCGFEVGKAVGHDIMLARRRGVASNDEIFEAGWATANAIKCVVATGLGLSFVGSDYLAYQCTLGFDVASFLAALVIEHIGPDSE